MVSKKIWLLVISLLFCWMTNCLAHEFTTITGSTFKIYEEQSGKVTGKVLGTGLIFGDLYCKTIETFLCLHLRFIKVTVPKESYLENGKSWTGEFGEKNTVTLISNLSIFGKEIGDVFMIRQDWSNVQKTSHNGAYDVFYHKKKGIVAFRRVLHKSSLWFSKTDNGYMPKN